MAGVKLDKPQSCTKRVRPTALASMITVYGIGTLDCWLRTCCIQQATTLAHDIVPSHAASAACCCMDTCGVEVFARHTSYETKADLGRGTLEISCNATLQVTDKAKVPRWIMHNSSSWPAAPLPLRKTEHTKYMASTEKSDMLIIVHSQKQEKNRKIPSAK
ncbi:hypothetical protein ACJQWK_06669 [Exserohilum turcicum]|uniref:Uncharacterized protein n=1 Tax=Exserohilum turcicum (strain 28A) TaxID=671987 RepID=R0JX11_EXST2|nr:uncharacterized protein SETTUDRAFT_179905 [Exserohilum turcica Et28A]EOA85478.1 hypothetical protein SETTUDRAFT_179905 [Exserohilum turcica Et28A]